MFDKFEKIVRRITRESRLVQEISRTPIIILVHSSSKATFSLFANK